MYHIYETTQAKKHFDKLYDFFHYSTMSSEGLERFLKSISHCYDHLRENPEMFPYHHNPELRKLQYRKAIVNQYIILYTVEHLEKTVYIHVIANGRTDYEARILQP